MGDDDNENNLPRGPRRRPLSNDQQLAVRIQKCNEAHSETRGARALTAGPLIDVRSTIVTEALRENGCTSRQLLPFQPRSRPFRTPGIL